MKSFIRTALSILVSLAMIASAILVQPDATLAQLTDEERAELEQQLAELEQEIKETQSTLSETRQQTASYQRDRAILDAQILAVQRAGKFALYPVGRLLGVAAYPVYFFEKLRHFTTG